MKKVIRNGKVGVLISHGYGSGWYTSCYDEQVLFSPEIIDLVENNKLHEITDEFCSKIFNDPNFYSGGSEGLKIYWLDEGTIFQVQEYDGAESLLLESDLNIRA